MCPRQWPLAVAVHFLTAPVQAGGRLTARVTITAFTYGVPPAARTRSRRPSDKSSDTNDPSVSPTGCASTSAVSSRPTQALPSQAMSRMTVLALASALLNSEHPDLP